VPLSQAVEKREGQFKKDQAPRVLGFVSNMDEWMLAADVLVTKV
jgi:UDP-N-acetylglucosamine:LPS N-acetylglucosamine transferase